MSTARPDPLQCAACAAPVPLVAGDHGVCPNCQATYPIPETYQTLRAEAAAVQLRPQAEALLKALGKPPPLLVRALTLFVSPLFIMFGLGLWIAFGVYLGVVLLPVVGRHVFHVLTYDVWSEQRQMQIFVMVPLSMIVLGITAAGWARKRGTARGGLQAALAATPPTRPGGPKQCRHCAAPLASDPGDLTARCAYCHADNLVEMPASWIAQMKKHARTLTSELDAAVKMWADDRRALRRSLIRRAVISTVLICVPFLLIFGASGGRSYDGATDLHNASGQPVDLPSWSERIKSRAVDASCDEPSDSHHVYAFCRDGVCRDFMLVPLRAGEVVTHSSAELPARTHVSLDMHEQTFYSEVWTPVAGAELSPGHPAKTRVPYSGWYRIVVTIPVSENHSYEYCASVR